MQISLGGIAESTLCAMGCVLLLFQHNMWDLSSVPRAAEALLANRNLWHFLTTPYVGKYVSRLTFLIVSPGNQTYIPSQISGK